MEQSRGEPHSDHAPLITALSGEKPRARRPSPITDIRSSRPVYVTRLTFRLLSTAMCAAIIGVLVDAIRTYQTTKNITNTWDSGKGRFEVWPKSLSLKGVYILLGAAVVGGAFSLLLSLGSCVGKVCNVSIRRELIINVTR